ncbi:MAG TPA: chemotaxis protein CheW [Vicinamibacterales bacterium]|jgi:chemotaxis-related protein WspB|nr:chemotaxis protein CheW [Vicinamibacterales bacterium]
MIALLFDVDGQRYGLDIRQIVEIVPAVRLRRLPSLPPYVAGVCRFRGAYVPVLDLSLLIAGVPAAERLSTRLVLVRHPGPAGEGRILGLLAEHAAQGLDEQTDAPSSTGVASPEAPYLGPLTASGGRTVQHVRVEQLLPLAVRERLFSEAERA